MFWICFGKLVNAVKISLSTITLWLILAAEPRCKPSSPYLQYQNKHSRTLSGLNSAAQTRQTDERKKKKKKGGAVRMCGIEAWPQNETVLAVSNFSQFLLKTPSCPIWCLECPSESRPTQGRPDGCGPAAHVSPLAGGTCTRIQVSLSRPH